MTSTSFDAEAWPRPMERTSALRPWRISGRSMWSRATPRWSVPVWLLLTVLAGCPRGTPCRDASIDLPDAPAPDAPPPSCIPPAFEGRPVVYAHGPARPMEPGASAVEFLAVIDTEARAIVEYIPIECGGFTGSYLDLAVAADGTVMLSGGAGLVRFDPVTHECTTIRGTITHNPGTDLEWYETVASPNNLTYVPPGVLDPTREMLAAWGYHYHDEQRQYYESGFFRYDPSNGDEELVFEWPEDLTLNISGDLVVVTDFCTGVPRSFMTMAGRREATRCHSCADGEMPGVDCGDCLYEYDVRHGTLGREITLLPADHVFGLALFGDSLFGFSEGDFWDYGSGQIFAISAVGATPEITEIPVTPPEGFRSIHFNGAGSTSVAPILF
jgi:hypothetical protein